MNPQQIWAIARYEVLMAFRRRSLVILTVLFVLGILVFALISRDSSASNALSIVEVDGKAVYMQYGVAVPDEVIPAWMQGVDLTEWQGSSQLVVSMLAAVTLICIALVMFMNETIPLDNQHKVRELLNALPMSRASYLGGKLIGAWLGTLLIALVAFLSSLAIFLAIFKTFSLGYFLLLWAVFVLPVILICTAMSVLLSSWVGSRRAAIMISLLIIPLAMFVYSIALPSLGAVGVLIEPSYAMFVLLEPNPESVNIVRQRISDVIPWLIAFPLISWLLAYGNERLREAR